MIEREKTSEINITESVLNKIKTGKITMRPHWQFVAEKLGLESVALLVLLVAILAFSLIMDFWQANEVARLARFGLPGFRFVALHFPYELVIVVLLAIVGINYLLKRLDWGYKRSWLVWLGMSIAVVILLAVGSLTIGLQRKLLLAEQMPAAGMMRAFYGNRIRSIADEALIGTVNNNLEGELEFLQEGLPIPVPPMFLKCKQMHRSCDGVHRGDRIKLYRQRINNELLPWGFDIE